MIKDKEASKRNSQNLSNLEKQSAEEMNLVYKENNLFFSIGFFRLFALLTVALLAYVGVILGTIHFVDNLIQTIVHVNIEKLEKNNMPFENATGVDNATNFVQQVSSDFLDYFTILFILALITLLFLHLISQIRYSKKI